MGHDLSRFQSHVSPKILAQLVPSRCHSTIYCFSKGWFFLTFTFFDCVLKKEWPKLPRRAYSFHVFLFLVLKSTFFSTYHRLDFFYQVLFRHFFICRWFFIFYFFFLHVEVDMVKIPKDFCANFESELLMFQPFSLRNYLRFLFFRFLNLKDFVILCKWSADNTILNWVMVWKTWLAELAGKSIYWWFCYLLKLMFHEIICSLWRKGIFCCCYCFIVIDTCLSMRFFWTDWKPDNFKLPKLQLLLDDLSFRIPF